MSAAFGVADPNVSHDYGALVVYYVAIALIYILYELLGFTRECLATLARVCRSRARPEADLERHD